MTTADLLSLRTPIEALRAGVPNRAAVRLLGSVEDAIEERFDAALDAVWSDRPAPGLMFAGGFGTGKSHLLCYLREVALQHGFVVSMVTVSKETPLSSPRAMFAAAMRNAMVPNRNDDAVTVALAELQRRAAAVAELEAWATTPDAGVGQVFAAMLVLLARQQDAGLIQRIEAFISGGKLPGKELREALRQAGAAKKFDLRGATEAALAPQRERFAPRLFQAAGFAGWCVLIDEVELIGRYGPLQRALAYAELARWLGLAAESRVPGLHVTAAITDDFADAVTIARQDEEKVPERLRLKGRPREAERALVGMRGIRDAMMLHPPTDDDLRRDLETLRKCYSEAYGWDAPALEPVERRADRTVRHHIRSWITQWDMLRLYGRKAAVDIAGLRMGYEEREDLVDGTEEGE
jgi:hypothetical protein